MDWANVTKNTYSPHLSNAYYPPDEHALYKDNFPNYRKSIGSLRSYYGDADDNVD